MKHAIKIEEVCKTYRSKQSRAGFAGQIRDLVRARYSSVKVLDSIHLEIVPGECLGFLGPNGAGKSTLTKILCGLQQPSAGTVDVLGFVPARKERNFFKQIGVVFGHKSSLWWDLPLRDSLECARVMYGIESATYQRNFKELVNSLHLDAVLDRPVRLLSLGERVKAELAANMLHNPKVLLLDEPTIGLDVVSKSNLRHHIRRWAREQGVAVFLTSHDVGDIESCCDRIALVHQGKIAFQGSISDFKLQIDDLCIITITHAHRPLSRSEMDAIHSIQGKEFVFCDKGIGFEITAPSSAKTLLLGKLAALSKEWTLNTRLPTLEEGLARRFTEMTR